MPDGTFHAQAWPRKRGKIKSQKQQDTANAFAQVAAWSAHPDAAAWEAATMMSQGTMLLPRDILIRCAYGTYIQATDADGNLYQSRRKVDKDIQMSLDQVTSQPGAMLWRNGVEWVGVPPGGVGYVLSYQGIDNVPAWVPNGSSAGGVGDFIAVAPSNALTQSPTDPFCQEGITFQATEDFTLHALWLLAVMPVNAEYTAVVGALDGGTSTPKLTSIAIAAAVQTQQVATHGYIRLPLDTPIKFKALDHFWLASMRMDGATTNPVGADYASTYPPMTAPVVANYATRDTTRSYAIGDTLNTIGGYPAHYNVGLEFTYQ